MLTEKEKERIRQEEIYRYEVRRDIESQPSPSSTKLQIWKFLNSPFGIYLLSSVLIGLIGFSYARWEEQRVERAQRVEMIRVAEDEISFRLRQVELLIDESKEAAEICRQQASDNDGTIYGEDLFVLLNSSYQLYATIRLGGIITVPADNEENLFVGNDFISIGELPYRHSYKLPEFQNDDLLELARKVASADDNITDPTGSLKSLQELIKKLEAVSEYTAIGASNFWVQKNTQDPDYELVKMWFSGQDKNVGELQQWILDIESTFDQILQNDIIHTTQP